MVEDVAGEVLPSGRMAYPLVVCIVNRRAGKTLETVARNIQRGTVAARRRGWYTAQTGADAGTTFREEWVPLIRSSPLAPVIKPRLSNGQESLTLPNGSMVKLFPPTEGAVHGQDADQVTVDEAWAFSDEKGTSMEAGFRPAMLTRPQRQLWIVSAGGTDESTWLLRYRELGRTLGIKPDQGLAYFEWHPAVDAEGNVTEDLDDPAVWARTHPAVGFTVDLEALQQDKATMGDDVFYRSYLNVFQSAAGARLIPEVPWKRCGSTTAAVDPDGPGVVCAYDVAMDYGWSAVLLAQPQGDQIAVEVTRYDRGDEWLADYVEDLHRRRGYPLAANGHGPVRSTTRELADRGLDVDELNVSEFVDASGELLRDVNLGRLVHRIQPPLDAAAAGAGKRELGDGWAFTRKGSTGDVSPIVAAAVAAHRARRPVESDPFIQVGV